jgi:hypothetical protein
VQTLCGGGEAAEIGGCDEYVDALEALRRKHVAHLSL